jgi:hypothetical protein
MQHKDPYILLGNRDRLINDIRKFEEMRRTSSNTILSNSESNRLNNNIKQGVLQLLSDEKLAKGQNFYGEGVIKKITSNRIVIIQKKKISSYNYIGKSFMDSCLIEIQFDKFNFGSFNVDDNVFVSGKIISLNVDRFSNFGLFTSYNLNNDWDILVENVSFEKRPKSDGPCFIATAAYQNYDAPIVKELRKFRDTHLLNNYAGRLFINLYYKFSPPMAKVIQNSIVLRKVAKICIVLPTYLLTKIIKKI